MDTQTGLREEANICTCDQERVVRRLRRAAARRRQNEAYRQRIRAATRC